MRKRRALLVFIAGVGTALLPLVAVAQGLVPCTGINCQACDVISLIQNIINFAIGLSIPIAMALFAWAGILYFTSAAQQENISRAKKIFKDAFIGIIIVLGAYLMIETLFHAILNDKYFEDWNTIECVEGRKTDGKLNELLNEVIGKPTVVVSHASYVKGSVDLDTVCQQSGGINNNGVCTSSTQASYCPATSGYAMGTDGTCHGSIASAAATYKGQSTAAGPDNGNKACAWAVNNVLESVGIKSIDGSSVSSMEEQLKAGRGTQVATAGAKAGDIIVWRSNTVSHVGICQNAGCTSALSNSSKNAAFTNVTGSTFMGVEGRIYSVK